MMMGKLGIVLTMLVTLASCSADTSKVVQEDFVASGARMMASAPAPQAKEQSQYLAYEHSLTVSMAAASVPAAYEQLAAACREQPQALCTLLTANLHTGEFSSAHLRMRVAPDRVADTLASARTLGEVTHQNTQVDDLQSAVVDNDKRIEMLLRYRDKLEQLEQTSAEEVESLIRIASELSRVQSDLEYAQGEKARLLQRIDFQVVNIHLQTQTYTGFWAPIGHALGDFGEHLSEGIANTLIVVAYAIPGVIVLLVLLLLARVLWRKLR
ncbi:DUF4349 domain-containing protein [Simiduia sp. 21SJ11W-1]|uniref:DUF4349 domain-containing protein n=1 Tax=Simiduia sp. 21SJ11W-1 TaxID=2909669 RepID=UPI00209CB75E|nr:DUF4349 domain-containing protein [Simiduia sp. 21SJ11W-1]UTA48035.1 DUF4349 domain-containing protein [Simiduia sp. 21SJ11W-1]